MRMHAVVALAVVSLIAVVRSQAAASDAKEEAVKKELQAFKGTWRLISREVDGKKISEEELKDVILTDDGAGRFSARRGDKVFVEGAIRLDPTTKPKTIDVTFTAGESKGKTVLGIYEIEGDTFRVCHACPGDERPTEFSAKAGDGQTLIAYKREKK